MIFARRAVSDALQEQFAALSGDRNPMHMDAVAARRTPAGAPVVHGIHSLLWVLDAAVAEGELTARPSSLRVKFTKWVYVGDSADAVLNAGAERGRPRSLSVSVGGLVVLSVTLKYDESSIEAPEEPVSQSPAAPAAAPVEIDVDSIEGTCGEVFTASAEDAAHMFPAAAKLLGGGAIAEIAACSYIVGMRAPGLHSIFTQLDLRLRTSKGVATGLHYVVQSAHSLFRKLTIAVTGRHVWGTISALARVPPVQQASVATLAGRVQHGEFAHVQALIVGGSRGLGELTAKLLAAGGGRSVLTYAKGRADAEAVAEGICSHGGVASVLPYDVELPPAPQLASLHEPITHLFYFATNPIFRPKGALVHAPFLAAFSQYYLRGFHDVCVELTRPGAAYAPPSGGKLGVYYPSSVAVGEDRPAGMTEYSMMKAAGELLCEEMNRYLPGVRIVMTRLPRLLTDQTTSVVPQQERDPVEVMLPILREVVAER